MYAHIRDEQSECGSTGRLCCACTSKELIGETYTRVTRPRDVSLEVLARRALDRYLKAFITNLCLKLPFIASYRPAKISISLLSAVRVTIAFLVLAVLPTTIPRLLFLPSAFRVFTLATLAPSNIFSTASLIWVLFASGCTRKVYFFSPIPAMLFSVMTGLRITS